jgi:hypothetical protein
MGGMKQSDGFGTVRKITENKMNVYGAYTKPHRPDLGPASPVGG